MRWPDDYHRTFHNGFRIDWYCAGTVASSHHADRDGMFFLMGLREVSEDFEAWNCNGEEIFLRFFRCNRGSPEVELDPDELCREWLASEGLRESLRRRAMTPEERRASDERLRNRGRTLAQRAM